MFGGINIKIGTGHKGNAAGKVTDDLFNIGRGIILSNSVSYWISESIFNANVYIMKNTDEGCQIHMMIRDIESVADIKKLHDYIDSLVIRNISISDINKSIKFMKAESYSDGRASLRHDLNHLLNT